MIVGGKLVTSCLMLAPQADGAEIVTIEGLESDAGLDPVQRAFVELGAIQCGFCMPGMIVQAKFLLSRGARPSEDEIRRGLEGNVCRCTGYAKVIDAIVAAAGGA